MASKPEQEKSSTESAPKQFSRLLSELERTISVPVVSGELRAWVASVKKKLDALTPIRDEQERLDREVLDETVEKDPELSSRVEKLRKRLDSLAETFDSCQSRLEELASRQDDGPDRATESYKAAASLRKELLHWVVERRALEVELDTWYMEALNRDRGAVD